MKEVSYTLRKKPVFFVMQFVLNSSSPNLFSNFFHLSLLWFLCCVGESENTPPPVLGLAANTLPPDPVTSTAPADSFNGISENHSTIVSRL